MKYYWAALAKQMLNSTIVAGIAALSMYTGERKVSSVAVAVAFGLSFLIEMRHYRGINGNSK